MYIYIFYVAIVGHPHWINESCSLVNQLKTIIVSVVVSLFYFLIIII